jgi:hypothetical protein
LSELFSSCPTLSHEAFIPSQDIQLAHRLPSFHHAFIPRKECWHSVTRTSLEWPPMSSHLTQPSDSSSKDTSLALSSLTAIWLYLVSASTTFRNA